MLQRGFVCAFQFADPDLNPKRTTDDFCKFNLVNATSVRVLT